MHRSLAADNGAKLSGRQNDIAGKKYQEYIIEVETVAVRSRSKISVTAKCRKGCILIFVHSPEPTRSTTWRWLYHPCSRNIGL